MTQSEGAAGGERTGEALAPGMDLDAAQSDSEPDTQPDPLARAEAEVLRTREQLLRTAADFDNFRKRSRREISDAQRQAREELLRDLLPVFDNLERAAEHARSSTDLQALTQGIDLVVKQFADTLGRLGIERVHAVGQPFDPALHEAIQHLETGDFAPGTVAAEVQAGYRMGDRLVRPALVVVAKPLADA